MLIDQKHHHDVLILIHKVDGVTWKLGEGWNLEKVGSRHSTKLRHHWKPSGLVHGNPDLKSENVYFLTYSIKQHFLI